MIAEDLTRGESQTAARLVRDVANVTGVHVAAILSQRRDRPLVYARFLMAAALMGAGFTCSRAGRALGKRDHGTVCYAQLQFDILRDDSKKFRAQADELVALGWVLKGRRDSSWA